MQHFSKQAANISTVFSFINFGFPQQEDPFTLSELQIPSAASASSLLLKGWEVGSGLAATIQKDSAICPDRKASGSGFVASLLGLSILVHALWVGKERFDS